jgi:acetyl-CoA carboxylase biotin carboxylase subunit
MDAVAVYSEADRTAPHVHAADAAVELGPAPARDSYLNVQRILAAARSTGADAVHPGYGFLAEREHFARAVEAAGLTFIGPPADAIRLMGEKTEARRRMAAAGVPIVPGTTSALEDGEAAARAAEKIGFPVLLKAAAGGGGKGMRVATTADEVRRGFRSASSEAQSAFGDGAVYLERLLQRPRHVEIQVLADRRGAVTYIGERECSVQRRHQKLIEESPSPAVNARLREAMGAAAVRAAESVGYVSAGTVEFLVDQTGQFYFLEMNTRLQVEHPVTEMVYGVDLVRAQLRIAAGEPLATSAEPLSPRGGWPEPRGHAIECRITAEDPFAGFLPATGRLTYFRAPAGPGVRWDGGVETGSEITPYYDSLLGKLIVWADTRREAIRRMRRALDELVVVGIPTAQPFHRRVMDEPAFGRGEYDIGYLDAVGDALLARTEDRELLRAVAVAAALVEDERRGARAAAAAAPGTPEASPWLRAARLAGLR